METYTKIVSLIVLLSIFSIVGYRIINPPVSAMDLLDDIYEKASRVEKFNITYSLSMTMDFFGVSYTIEGDTNVAFAHKVSKTTISLKLPEILKLYNNLSETLEIYTLPEGEVISCEKPYPILDPEKYECKEIEYTPYLFSESSSFDPQAQMSLIKEWKEKGIANISYLGKKEVIERKCENFRFDIDLSELMKNMTGLSFGKEKINYTFFIFSCFDDELGVSLESYMEMEIKTVSSSEFEKSMTIGMKIVYEAKELNFDVDENKIKLPVPEDEVMWLPRFNILETKCEANSNIVKLAIKARKEIKAGNAILNVSWSEYELRKYKYYSLTAETFFPELKKDEIGILNFSLASPLKEDESFTLNLKVDGLEYTGYCSTYKIIETWPITGFFQKIIEKVRNVTIT